jgi:hypothetical protein
MHERGALGQIPSRKGARTGGGTVVDGVQRGGVLDRSPQRRAPREPRMERRSGRVPAQGESGIAAEAGKFVDL